MRIFQNEDIVTTKNCLIICWQIWKARNNVIFRSVNFAPADFVHASAAVGASYRAFNLATERSPRNYPDLIKWHPPPNGVVKLNFDGSVSSNDGGAASFVIRDHNGILVAGSRNLGNVSVPVAESAALKDGLQAVKRFNYLKIQMEGDAALIINYVQGKCDIPWRIISFIKEIAHLSDSFESIAFAHIYREANFLADVVASCGHGLSNPKMWLNRLSSSYLSAYRLNSISLRHPKRCFVVIFFYKNREIYGLSTGRK
ncbi:PREDICTED: putative ribonuclease H protein At1g65750-like [Fragaria vesca subsp. vesca]